MYQRSSFHFAHPFATSFAPSCTPLLQVSPSNARGTIFSPSTPLHPSCLLSLLLRVVIPSYSPSWPLWSVPGHLAERQAQASHLCFQACWLHRQGRTWGYNMLDQPSGLPGRNGTPKDTHQKMSSGPSAASWPFLSSLPFSFHPAKLLHLLSLFSIFTSSHHPFSFLILFFFFLFFFIDSCVGNLARKHTDLWPGKPGNTGLPLYHTLLDPQNESRSIILPALMKVPTKCLVSGKAGLAAAGRMLCAHQHPAPLRYK